MTQAGRPSTYKEEYCDMVDEYIAQCEDTIVVDGKLKVNLPTQEGFIDFIGVPQSTFYDWKNQFPKFSESLGKLLREQKRRLLNSGLSGDYNSTIAKLILASNHGMSDKTDVTSGGEKINSVSEVKWVVVNAEDEAGNS
jgi:hypothetical protein